MSLSLIKRLLVIRVRWLENIMFKAELGYYRIKDVGAVGPTADVDDFITFCIHCDSSLILFSD